LTTATGTLANKLLLRLFDPSVPIHRVERASGILDGDQIWMPPAWNSPRLENNLLDCLLTQTVQSDEAVLADHQLLGLRKQTLLTLKEQVFPVVFVLPIHKPLAHQGRKNLTSPQLATIHAMRILAETQ
jgi:hypothetical protein